MKVCSRDLFLTIVSIVTAATLTDTVSASPRRHRHARRSQDEAPYSRSYDPGPTCRYPDGTPFDPDIIGGPNHVGDGGPAGNLSGRDPCGF